MRKTLPSGMRLLFGLLLTWWVMGAHGQPMYGRTTGPLAYLTYGLGQDRLGGAKMTYLDSNILVSVIDSTADAYKVQLSKAHVAYLPKASFARADSVKLLPYYTTGSWKVWGDSAADYVTVSLPEKLPYKSSQQMGPARIVVDVFGAVSNTNWITQLKTATDVKAVWYEQVEDDVFRIYIELKHPRHWGYKISYQANTLQIKVARQPAKLQLRGLKIAIDAGHGGANTGAAGSTGALEKDYTLLIAKELETLLKKGGAKVYMTRTHDTDLTMTERTVLLREQQPNLLLSIHLNSSGNAAVSGVSTYYRYIGFRPLSQKILDRMLELGLNNFGNIGAFNFALSGPTEYPNCLVEIAFLSNAADEQKVLNPKFRKAAALKMYKGVEDWLREMR